MRLHFETQQTIPFPVELVFAFFANPENLPRLMPAWQKARIEEAVFAPPPALPKGAPAARLGVAAGTGTRLTLTFRPLPLFPMRWPWEARIEDFQWNKGFCDVQEQGPFVYWRHCHTIEAIEVNGRPGATLTDRVEYELPFASVSHRLDGILVRPQLARMFRFRQKRTLELLGLITRHRT